MKTSLIVHALGLSMALLASTGVRAADKLKVEDRTAFQKALKDANFESVRGAFTFNHNHYPIHNIYMRQVIEDENGNLRNKLIGTVLKEHSDPFAAACSMKP